MNKEVKLIQIVLDEVLKQPVPVKDVTSSYPECNIALQIDGGLLLCHGKFVIDSDDEMWDLSVGAEGEERELFCNPEINLVISYLVGTISSKRARDVIEESIIDELIDATEMDND